VSLVGDPALGHDCTTNSPAEKPANKSQQSILHFLICSTSVLSQYDIGNILSSTDHPLADTSAHQLRIIWVPQTAPTSHDQARIWSEKYWPTVYKGGNLYGPHPAILARATAEIQDYAGKYMELTMRIGLAASGQGIGEAIGAVVVDRSGPNGPSVVAVAGDARWNGIARPEEGGNGNAMAHAVMRVIGMVAKQRLALHHPAERPASDEDDSKLFADAPITTLEKEVYSGSTLAPGGYLCLDLELYLTHEPCMMCSMAILHSRFGRVIFGRRMPHTGGLAADQLESDSAGSNDSRNVDSSAYGLWWRPELNWKLLAWQWVDEHHRSEDAVDQTVHA